MLRTPALQQDFHAFLPPLVKAMQRRPSRPGGGYQPRRKVPFSVLTPNLRAAARAPTGVPEALRLAVHSIPANYTLLTSLNFNEGRRKRV